MTRRWIRTALAGAAVMLAACPESNRRSAPRVEPQAQKQASSDRFERCTTPAPREHGQVPPLSIAGTRMRQRGDHLVPAANASAAHPPTLTLGVLADTHDTRPATLSRIDQLVQQFTRAGVDAIVMLGGIDPSFEGTRQILRRLHAARPLLALPGNSISREGFQAAMRELGSGAVDLTLVHVVQLPQATLLAVPGYHLPHHLQAGRQGCSYMAADLRALAEAARSSAHPRILLAHGPPRGAGANAVDRSFGAINSGDPQLSNLIARAKLSGGLFAHVHESAGHATTTKGQPLPPSRWSETLLLNVGSADAIPHEHLDGRWRGPTAAIVKIRAGQLRYAMIESKPRPERAHTPAEDRGGAIDMSTRRPRAR